MAISIRRCRIKEDLGPEARTAGRAACRAGKTLIPVPASRVLRVVLGVLLCIGRYSVSSHPSSPPGFARPAATKLWDSSGAYRGWAGSFFLGFWMIPLGLIVLSVDGGCGRDSKFRWGRQGSGKNVA